jgi:hypothetical protein
LNKVHAAIRDIGCTFGVSVMGALDVFRHFVTSFLISRPIRLSTFSSPDVLPTFSFYSSSCSNLFHLTQLSINLRSFSHITTIGGEVTPQHGTTHSLSTP